MLFRSRYRLTNGLLISIAERYGNADYVGKSGPAAWLKLGKSLGLRIWL